MLKSLVMSAVALLVSSQSLAETTTYTFKPSECGINVNEGLGVLVTEICFGEAQVGEQAGFTAVQAKFSDGSVALYETDDVEYDSSTQKRLYVVNVNDPEQVMQELTITFTNRNDVEIPTSVQGILDVGARFTIKMKTVTAE